MIALLPNSEELPTKISQSNAGVSQNHNRFQLDVPRMVMTASVTVSFIILKSILMADPNSPISTVVLTTTGLSKTPTTPKMLPANQNFSRIPMSFQEKINNASVMKINLTSTKMVFNTSRSTGEVSMLREMPRRPKLELKPKLKLPLRPLPKNPPELLLKRNPMPPKLLLQQKELPRKPPKPKLEPTLKPQREQPLRQPRKPPLPKRLLPIRRPQPTPKLHRKLLKMLLKQLD